MSWELIATLFCVGIIYALVVKTLSCVNEKLKVSMFFLAIPSTIAMSLGLFVVSYVTYKSFVFAGEIGWVKLFTAIALLGSPVVVLLLGKPLFVKIVAVPYFFKLAFSKLRKEQLTYKTELETRFPIKRSIYEITGE